MIAGGQSLVVWITGLPQSGKSTFARRVAEQLTARHCILDGDDVRAALVPSPGYSDSDRDDFYASLGNLAVILSRQGIVVLVAATANHRRYREHVRSQNVELIEVYVDANIEECKRRDQKNLYGGSIDLLPGESACYEAPLNPSVTATGGLDNSALATLIATIGQHRRDQR